MKKTFILSVATLACAVALLGQVANPTSSSADFVRPGETEALPPAIAASVASIEPQRLAAHIAALSSPNFEGRALGSRGLEATGEYCAASLAVAGAVPLGTPDNPPGLAAYFHPVPLREISHASGQIVIEARRGDGVESLTFHSGVDAAFPEMAPQAFTAPLVFAGYGIREQNPARDDYRGLDVKDRIVVVVAGVPPGAEWQAPALVSRYASTDSIRQRFAAKAQLAASLGARALLAIEDDAFVAKLASRTGTPSPVFFLPADGADASLPPVVQVSAHAADVLLRSAGMTSASARAAAPAALSNVMATVRATGDERLVASRNVLALVPGSDPKLRDQAVVIGAHMDHLGRTGDALYAGADDNASGVAGVIEMARALASAPRKPARTVVFACWTGEEEGHLGSVHYVRHPAWALERTSVYLNLDMIGHPWTAEEVRKLVQDTRLERGEEFLAKVKPADFIELGVAENRRDLGPVLARAARGTSLALHLDWTDGKNGGSDYRDFARRGLPFVRFFGNYFEGYHEPTDTFEKLDVAQVVKMTRLALASAWLFADAPAAPRSTGSTRR
ncbi:MAG: M20/M25/M40 family metallo-hydrolase [Bacteroidales bacterium]